MCAGPMSVGSLGYLSIIPATVLLTISFFVLLGARKVDSQGLKAFGFVIAVLLWISAALIFAKVISHIGSDRYHKGMSCMDKGMMGNPMHANNTMPMR